jgi:hypothetical protein
MEFGAITFLRYSPLSQYPTRYPLVLFLPLFLLALLAGCSAGFPLRSVALEKGLTAEVAGSPNLPLLRVFKSGQGQRLHVYIEGDGSPWLRDTVAALDPTPTHPLLFPWFLDDSAPALYLGRPCYFGLNEAGECSPFFWTFGRYGQPVVDSMLSALVVFLDGHPFGDIVFIGHSGGAALAILLAHSMDAPATVVGISANINTDAWTSYHRYTPLWGSLNPAKTAPRDDIKELYFFCNRDKNTPYEIMLESVVNRTNSTVVLLEDCGHEERVKKYQNQIMHRSLQ